MYIEKHSVYTSNPLLGEYFEIKLPEREISVNQVTYRFFFSKVSREYKVLRLVVKEHIHVSELKIYTLGVENDRIYSFDIETEKFKSLPLPEVGNCLCLTDEKNRWSAKIDIWWMKEYGISESWTKYTILVDCPRAFYKNLYRCCKCLASYRPESKRFIRIKVYGDVIAATRYIPKLKAEYNYYVRHCNRLIQLATKFHYPIGRVFLVGLCNGHTCFANGATRKSSEKHFVYINNPLLGEYFELKLPQWETSVCRVTYGFCFNKASDKYKVLRIVVREITNLSELEVYTLGVGEKWRNVGEILCPVWYDFGKVNINNRKGQVPANSTGTGKSTLELEASRVGNYLCFSDYYNLSTNIDIWWMKEYVVSESWTKDIILVNSIPRGMVDFNFEQILMWKDGEILIQSGRKLASYNPNIKSFRMIYVYGKVIAATTYIPSFYSLKTIMGDYFQVTNVYPKTQIV
ncbi:hypothetical protein R3W88_025068 [Solanum pinnatisectum]|uniref:F-box associated beta-propeller type 3 domain-containing protein n=1 Tax=Solanum pinnatisectum TaxID=50273 RepID=A0AAV9M5B4_9SOLN|nr:hypothetical protein R3W88_025068 [Solanum pinnatisectum]